MTESLASPDLHLGFLLLAIAIYAVASIGAAVFHRRGLAIVYPACMAAAAIASIIDLAALIGSIDSNLKLPLGLPSIGLHWRLDALSAFFGIVVNFGVLIASLYGTGLDRRRDLSPRIEPFVPAFAAAMNLVLIADDAFAFLFSWELMSFSSWALVVARHQDAECRRAGYVYLVMAAIGTASLLFAFGGMAGAAGNYAFDVMRGTTLSPIVSGLILAAAVIGTGSKAGIAPLHAWLPLAHPAAPSHVSALMSGVMTKVAIYGLIRIVFDLLGSPVWWWSLPLLLLGSVTAVFGLLYALLDNDVKRMLAYSTVENIGIVFVGLGLALAFKTTGLAAAAAVAMAASLLHVMNHSWFKSLLFLGAGAVLHATGRRDFGGLGGLIHRMPVTAALWLVGALSISALPPFNGFVSEWLLFQAVLTGPSFPEPFLRFLSPAVGAMLALAAALAAACFVRAFGMIYLGRPRSSEAARAREVPRPQQAAMAILAAFCLLAGLFGSAMITLIQPLLQMLTGSPLPGASTGPTPFSLVAFDAARSIYDAPTIACFLLISGTLTTLLVHRLSGRRARRGAAWDCGFPDPSPMTQYTASSFSQPLRRVYGASVFGAVEEVDMPPPGELRPARLTVRLQDYVWEFLYEAPARAVIDLSQRLNVLQFLTIRRYLVLMFSALLVLLVIAVVWL